MTDRNQTEQPIIQVEPVRGLIDYFCPFCGQKLFRGKVRQLNMVCDHCNKLVTDADLNKES